MLTQLAFAVVNGLAAGAALFLVAAGLTLVFGILRILNFSHGAFFMVGAYLAFTLLGRGDFSLPAYLGASLAAGVGVGVIGLVTDRLVLRRLRDFDEAYMLIATFGLLTFVQGVVNLVWGVDYHTVSPPEGLSAIVMLGPLFVPAYSLFLIGVGVVVFVLLEVVTHRLWVGKIIGSLANDPWMTGLLGVNVPVAFTAVVMAAFLLGGLAGGLLLPNQSLSPELGGAYTLQAFIAVIIGGLGSVRGAFVAALALGLVDSLSSVLIPNVPGLAIFAAMILFLLVRPQGLVPVGAAPERLAPAEGAGSGGDGAATARGLAVGGLAALAVLSLPLWANDGVVFLAGVALVAALFSLSWNLLFGFTGLATFGHAGFFALGAYLTGVGLTLAPAVPFLALLAGSAALGGAAALLVGIVALRRTGGIQLAILTLATSEIVQILITYSAVLGGADGLSGIPRPTIGLGPARLSLAGTAAYFWFLFAACGLAAGALWWGVSGRYGRVLRCIRQDAERAAFLGVDVARYRLAAFVVSGAVAALAGGLGAPWAQIVTPSVAGWLNSTQPILNALLGGAGFFWGPVVGTALFAVIAFATRTLAGLSEIVVGLVLMGVVLAAPGGLLGALAAFWRARAGGSGGATGLAGRPVQQGAR